MARTSRRVEAVRRNLRVVFDRAPSSDEIRSVFSTFGRSLGAFTAAPAASGQWREIAGTIEADRLLSAGRGCVLLSAHLGAWELGSTLLAANGVPTASIVRRMSVGNGFFDRLRGRVEAIPVETPRAVVRSIAGGKTVCFAMDEPPAKDAPKVMADFFDRRIPFSAGAFRLAAILDAPLFVAAGIWNAQGRLDIPVRGPFSANDPPRVVAALEELIRSAPTQWVLFEDRFR